MPLLGPTLSGAADLADLLTVPLALRPDEPALITEAKTWTWEELHCDVDILAAHLLARGLRGGDRVASLTKETYGLTEAANCLSNLSDSNAKPGSLGTVKSTLGLAIPASRDNLDCR